MCVHGCVYPSSRELDGLGSWDWIQTFIVFILLQVPDYDVRETAMKNAKVNGPTFLDTNILGANVPWKLLIKKTWLLKYVCGYD